MEMPGKLRCYCHNHCPPDAIDEAICVVDAGGKCFAAAEEVINPNTGLLEAEYSYGCFAPGDPTFMQCKGHLVNHHIPAGIQCCDSEDFCNEQLKPTYTPSNITDSIHHHSPYHPPTDYVLLYILLAAVISLLVMTLAVVIYIVCKYRTKVKNQKYLQQKQSLAQKSLLPPSLCMPKDPAYFCVDSSGSGSMMPLLVQRTIGRQVSLRQRIGKGRYGEVYLGEWGDGTFVAVKSFHSVDEASWIREKQIYMLTSIKHPNILVSMGWDIRSMDSITQMIIVTDYHPNGSLYDYLQTHTLHEGAAAKLILSLIAGLTHLHMELEGKPYKPGIAHRDLKSKNILVKTNGECCIADFGLAVCSVSGEKGVDCIPTSIKQGTKRYMAPEILDDSIKIQWFDAYKQADMYATALILWEIGRRCVTGGNDEKPECETYEVPFFDYVTSDPSFEDMKKIVVTDEVRPGISQRWLKSRFLREVVKVMRECWHKSPQVRLTALRVKKTLTEARDFETCVQII